MNTQIHATTRTQSDGALIYYPIGRMADEQDLARYVGGAMVHIFIIPGAPAPDGTLEDEKDPPLPLADGWYDASDQDESPDAFAERLFAEARQALAA